MIRLEKEQTAELDRLHPPYYEYDHDHGCDLDLDHCCYYYLDSLIVVEYSHRDLDLCLGRERACRRWSSGIGGRLRGLGDQLWMSTRYQHAVFAVFKFGETTAMRKAGERNGERQR